MIAWCIHVRFRALEKVQEKRALRALPVTGKWPTHRSSLPHTHPENTAIA